ncbi:nitrite reductase [Bacillus sp. FJAT-28004]|uniref:nitrite reductase n=1 Tax=Bacillus sp. FJAT-28004 TaxID=1679165 RepID=UPI0006B5D1FE|nr:nitrite reductase [Bacillus sp. FJAT-28004]
MNEKIKIAVSPAIQVGGSLFTPLQLMTIGSLIGSEANIEMTPFKQLYVEIPLDQEDEITEKLRAAGLEVNPSGFTTKSLIACNFCKWPEDAGLDIARKLNQAIAGIVTPTPMKVGYAGCALGTSEPLLKDIGVVKMRNTFDVFVGGEPKGLKTSFAQLLLTALSEEQLIPTITNLIYYYKDHAKGKEKFSKFVNRITIEQLKKVNWNERT